ncbi:MAG TPA: glucokinase [Xanthobacteraceae bacterium]
MSNGLAHTLLGDIGATNARFSLVANGAPGPVAAFEVARYPQFVDAVAEFLKPHQGRGQVTQALIAAAGPVEDGRCSLTNCPWIIDAAELQSTFGLARARVLNDFEATARSLPKLGAADLHPIGGGRAVPGAAMAVLGPGTGLGVAGLVGDRAGAVVIASEGGHATMAAASRREEALIDHLRQKFGHVSAERLISGVGLEHLYQASAALDGQQVPPRSAAEITKAALAGTCPTARAALDAFCAFLGDFAGNVALMFGARGGVYIAGGIAPRVVEYMAGSKFRERFEAKGRLRPYLEAVPTNVIVHPAATFVGLASLVADEVADVA